MWDVIVPSSTDVQHLVFWLLIVSAVACILLMAYCLCEFAGGEPLALLSDPDEDRRMQLQRVFPGYFGGQQ